MAIASTAASGKRLFGLRRMTNQTITKTDSPT
jgi:hypothetical protein